MGGRRAAASPTTFRLTLTERKFVFARGLCGKAAGANFLTTRKRCEVDALWRVRLIASESVARQHSSRPSGREGRYGEPRMTVAPKPPGGVLFAVSCAR